jgi:membrane protein implicated in regulation of membrane protease activity
MTATVTWFVIALVVLGMELATGTFYMLVLSAALAVGGLSAWAGMNETFQVVSAALAGIAGVLALRAWKARQKPSAPEVNQHLDIGQLVQVESVHEDGSLRVHHRGSLWEAELASAEVNRDQPLYIVDQRGSTLILGNHKTH